jgi:Leucine-rich repeat (LRR) protein
MPYLVDIQANYNGLTSIDLTGSTGISSLGLAGNSLTSIDLTGLVNLYSLDFENSNLSQESVDYILTFLANGSVSGGSVNLSGGTSAPPSATGLAAKTTLEARGWSVFVN